MVTFLTQLLLAIRSWFARRARLEAENLILRQQLIVLRRKSPTRVRLWNIDRFLLVWSYRLYPSFLDAIIIVQPETVIRWHQRGFRACWGWKSRRVGGRPRMDSGIRALIRRMNHENPLWGAPRIHGELLMLGIEVAESTVGRYMVRRRRPPSQGWKTFLRNHAEGVAAIDVFVAASASFRLLYVIIILAHDRRNILRTAVTEHPTAAWLLRQVTEAFPWDTAPRYLLRDHDSSYGAYFCNRIEAMGITEVITAPRSPWQNGYVERVIGSIRRECLDHIVIFNQRHLRRVLSSYVDYYY